MSSPYYESADLLIKLYDLRRETTMRDARSWFATGFHPETVDDVLGVIGGPDSARFRMVTSYWEMAASFVNNGAIDEQMFSDANGEHVIVFAKLEPFIEEYRDRLGQPAYLANLERLVLKGPDARERLAAIRERFKALAASRPVAPSTA